MEWTYLLEKAIFIAILVVVSYFGKKYLDADSLKVIIDTIIPLIKDAERTMPGTGRGAEKFDTVVAMAEAKLTDTQKKAVKKSIWKDIPSIVEHAFTLVEPLLLLKWGKK